VSLVVVKAHIRPKRRKSAGRSGRQR
jgi:hypothetical protein